MSTEILISAAKKDPVKGQVIFKDCLISDSSWGMLFSRKSASAFHVKFEDCVARNICQNSALPAIGLEVTDYRNDSEIGGFTFDNLLLDYPAESPYFVVRGSRFGSLKHFRDVKGSISISNDIDQPMKYINYDPSDNLNVDLKWTTDNK